MTTLILNKSLHKYAKALLDVVAEKGLDAVINNDMKLLNKFFQAIDSNNNIDSHSKSFGRRLFLMNKPNQEKILKSVLSELSMSSTTMNFIIVLLHNNNLDFIKDICMHWEDLNFHYHNYTQVTVISALPINKKHEEAIEKMLHPLCGKSFYLHKEVDETILGGLILKIGSQVYDDSIRGKLSSIRNNIKEYI